MGQTEEFWIGDEPIKYKVRKTEQGGDREAGVRIVRCEGSDENAEQALMEIAYDGDTLRLTQIDGDLDAKKRIAADQRAAHGFSIWRRIWKIAVA